jgi:hypothetical protein
MTDEYVAPGPGDCKGRAERKQAKLWTLAEIEASDAPQWAGDDWPVDENGVHVDPLIARLAVEDSCPAESDAFISAFLAYRALSPEQRAVARRTGKVPPTTREEAVTYDGEVLEDGRHRYLDDVNTGRRYSFLRTDGQNVVVVAEGGRVEMLSPRNLRLVPDTSRDHFEKGNRDARHDEGPELQWSKHESAPPDDSEPYEFAPEDPGPFDVSKFTGKAPERRWIVQDWIAEGVVNSLYGTGGIGKTLLAQQLAYCLATEVPFLGVRAERRTSLCVLCEDDHKELHRRHDDITDGLGCAPAEGTVTVWPRVKGRRPRASLQPTWR